jgi:molybdate transport system substrate-binding protein
MLALALAGGLIATPGHSVELTVAAASSLREPLTEISRRFESAHSGLEVRTAFGASNVLAAQARAGARIDVLVSADEHSVDALASAGLIRERVIVATNRLVVIVSRENAGKIDDPSDLGSDATRRIAIPEHSVPVGRYARDWLIHHGLLDAVAPKTVQTEHARATLIAVDRGLADAAIIYATDARLSRSATVAFEIPDVEQPRIVYVAASLAETHEPELSRAFLNFLIEQSSTSILEAAGFGRPPIDSVDRTR